MSVAPTGKWQQLRTFVDKLGFRLAVVLAVGLLPLMIVSVVRSQSVINEAVERSQAALVGETLQAIRGETLLIENAKAIALSLSQTMPTLSQDVDACDEMMKRTIEQTPFSFIGYLDLSGSVICSSLGQPFEFPVTDKLRAQIDSEEPAMTVELDAPVASSSVLFATHPVFSETNQLIGFTRVSLPHRELRKVGATEDSPAEFLTVQSDGVILTASNGREDAGSLMPALLPEETIATLPPSFRRSSMDGSPRLYSTVAIVEDELYAIGTWPEENEYASFYFENPALFPALMWLASLGVAWFATSILVTRDVLQLRSAMRSFAEKREIAPISMFQSAPGELRDLAASFIGMTEKIVREEAELEDTARQKDVLLREVHHRVKNNLQLITSIMAMQMHQSRSPEVTGLMKNLQDRVKSIATVHQNLYQTEGLVDVRIDELLGSIIKQVVAVGARGSDDVEVRTDLDPIMMNPDQSVPLALFATEALTNALKYIGSDEEAPFISVRLTALDEDRVSFSVENSVPIAVDDDDAPISTGLGAELMEAFAIQLEGDFVTETDEAVYQTSVEFPLEDLRAKDVA